MEVFVLKNSKKFILCGFLISLGGCATYEASMLSSLPIETALTSKQNAKVLVSWKLFDQNDSQKYLGRDLIAKGYAPMQVTIRNNSTDPMYLSPNNFNISLPSVNEVATKVHTSTAARVAGWGVPGMIIWPLLIPAVYDGIRSKEANAALDADYASKAVKEHTIQPHSSFNGVIFIPSMIASQDLELFLVNQRTDEKVLCPLIPDTR